MDMYDCRDAVLTLNRGFFGRGDMQKEFEEASFALEKGQVSKVVETASGLHLIQRFAPHQSIDGTNADLSGQIGVSCTRCRFSTTLIAMSGMCNG
jgi:hypothetical protein